MVLCQKLIGILRLMGMTPIHTVPEMKPCMKMRRHTSLLSFTLVTLSTCRYSQHGTCTSTSFEPMIGLQGGSVTHSLRASNALYSMNAKKLRGIGVNRRKHASSQCIKTRMIAAKYYQTLKRRQETNQSQVGTNHLAYSTHHAPRQ